MTVKLKFDRARGECTSVVMFPGRDGPTLCEYLLRAGIRADLRYRGPDHGCTIFLTQAPWKQLLHTLEKYSGNSISGWSDRTRPPESMLVKL